MKKSSLLILLFGIILAGTSQVGAKKQQAPLVFLISSERLLSESETIVTAAVSRDKQRFYVLSLSNLTVFDKEFTPLWKTDTSNWQLPTQLVVDSLGRIYLGDPVSGQITILSETGHFISTLRVAGFISFAALSNGNIVIAAPAKSKLFHIYDQAGRKLGSFGGMKQFDVTNETQNRFLNRGKVLVDSSDSIYYVFTYAPTPSFQKYSGKGKLIFESGIEGNAIDLQIKVSSRFLNQRANSEIGGIWIINSAAIDPVSERLYLGLNGSSESGVVYEYSPQGKKLREYAFRLGADGSSVVTGVRELAVRFPEIYLLPHDNQFSRFDINDARVSDVRIQTEETCNSQEWPNCPFTCPTGSPSGTINCKSALQQSIGDGQITVGSTCNQVQPGTSPGPGQPVKPFGACIATVTTCSIQQGKKVLVTHTVNIDCEAIRYKCVNNTCVVDVNGTFTTSNCNNTCTGSGGGGGGLECDPFNTDCLDPIVCEWPAVYNWCTCQCDIGPSPIIIDVLGDGFNLTDAASGVTFDLDSNGRAENLSWTAAVSDDAWLSLDRNGNGTIDNGAELFGNYTPQPPSSEPHGFIALAEYDKPANGGNGDRRIDSADAVFSALRLWQDTNHNGFSESNELKTVPSLGLASIDLNYRVSKRRDGHGNLFRYRAKVYGSDGAHLGRWAWDVFLVQ